MKKKYALKVGIKVYTLHISKQAWNRLRHKEMEAHESAGRTDPNALEMWVDPALPHGQLIDTLMHEVMHALWEDTGATRITFAPEEDPDNEEKFIRLMSPRLTAFLLENKEFMAELMGLSPAPPQEP